MNYLNKKNARARRAGQQPHRASQWKMATRNVLKWPDPGLSGSPSVAMREGPVRFRVVAAFQVVPVLPKRTTDDDATTTTRIKYSASHATARVGPPAQRVGGGYAWRGRGARRGSVVIADIKCRLLCFSCKLLAFHAETCLLSMQRHVR